MDQELEFIEVSKHENINERRKNEHYPLARLDDIEINFIHYKNKEEAEEKWNRRKERINWDNIFFKFEENYGATPDEIRAFDKLPYKNKLIMTTEFYPDLINAVQFEKFDIKTRLNHYHRYFDIVEWLNSGTIVRK